MNQKATLKKGSFLEDILTSGTFDQLETEKRRRLIFTNAVIILVIVFMLIFIVFGAIVYFSSLENETMNANIGLDIVIEDGAFSIILLIIFFVMRRTKSLLFGTISTNLLMTGVFSYFILLPHMGQIGPLWSLSLPLYYYYLFGSKWGMRVTIAYGFIVIGLFALANHLTADNPPELQKNFHFVFQFIYMAVYSSITVLAWVFEKARMETQSKLENSNLDLSARTAELQAAKRETDNILETVNEGLFLLSTELQIGNQYSIELESILEEKKLGGKNLLNLIKGKVTAKTLKNCEDYFTLLLRNDVEQDVLEELSPLAEVEFLFEDKNRVWSKTKYLTFDFNRIIIDNQIEAIFASVRDRTEQVELEKQLKKKEEQTKQQMELFMSILHVDPTMLSDFMDMAEREMISIDTELKRETRPEEYENLLNGIFQSMHNIKGNAGLIDLEFIASKAHEFENAISKIRDKKELSAASFSPLILLFGDINTVFGELKSIVHKVNKFQITLQDKRQTIAKMLIRTLDGYIRRLGGELEKEVELNAHDFIPESIPLNHITMVKDVLIQLVRNSVFHGIENPDDREKAGKARKGEITLTTKDVDGNVEITLLDDGAGLDLEKLKAKALEIGKYSKEELDSWDQSKIARLIFEPGISTSEAAVMAGGRGVGMNVIKDEVFRSGGKIKMRYATGKYFEFKIILPLTTDATLN
jgi:HPt (histidine-containing phosphotransfer) domain-containing protein